MSAVLISAAIDFGTTFSSWAFSFKHTFNQERTRVTTKTWNSPGHVSLKAPTCILILPDGKTADSFGYDAEKKYALLSEENNHTDWYFFRQFKMQLYSKGIDRNLNLKDINGKTLSAKTVFALSIKLLKDDVIETVRKSLVKNEAGKHYKRADETLTVKKKVPLIEERDFRWVLTVPAIWNDAAKQFMREAANEAGISNDNLYIGFEPEAASIYCRFLPEVDCKGSLSGLQPGSKYMILDAGGGTVDITVHEVGDEGQLNEKHKASGGNWGGTKVDQEYWKFIENIFGRTILERMKSEHMEDYLQMIFDFEVKKRLTQLDVGEKVTIRFPASLRELLGEELGLKLKEVIARSQHNNTLVVSGDKVRIDPQTFQQFFDMSVQKTVKRVSKILKHPDVSGCETILMVGGFSDSIILQQAMHKAFPGMNIVIPIDTELCVIKGAVIFGHDPSIVAERKLKLTYGVRVVHKKGSAECKHRPGKNEKLSGVLHCVDIFDAHVRVGQIVKLGEEQKQVPYISANPLVTEMTVKIFSSTESNPTFVTDASCRYIGSLKALITPAIFGMKTGSQTGRGFVVTFMFGGTEIKVKAVDDVSGKDVSVTLDCLGKM